MLYTTRVTAVVYHEFPRAQSWLLAPGRPPSRYKEYVKESPYTLRIRMPFPNYYIPYSGFLSREKTFANFAFLWRFAKVFSAKIYFQAIRESFLPRKKPAIWYLCMAKYNGNLIHVHVHNLYMYLQCTFQRRGNACIF